MKDWKDGIEVGDRFNAFVKKGNLSRTLGGGEAAGRLSSGCPCVCTKIANEKIESSDSIFDRRYFTFEKINTEIDN